MPLPACENAKMRVHVPMFFFFAVKNLAFWHLIYYTIGCHIGTLKDSSFIVLICKAVFSCYYSRIDIIAIPILPWFIHICLHVAQKCAAFLEFRPTPV